MLEHRAGISLSYQRRRFPQRRGPAWRTPRRPPRRRSRRPLPSAPPARPAAQPPRRAATFRDTPTRRTRAARGRPPHATVGKPLDRACPAAWGRVARARGWSWGTPTPSWGQEQTAGRETNERARECAARRRRGEEISEAGREGEAGREAGRGRARATGRGGGPPGRCPARRRAPRWGPCG